MSGRATAEVESADLVVQAQAGDREAFGELYRRYLEPVYSYLRLLLNNPHEAEDVTQQVFVRVFEALPRYKAGAEPFRAWLFVIVKNHALDHLRKHARMSVEDPDQVNRRQDAAGAADLDSLAWLTDADILLFIERLPLAQRQVLLLRYMLDLGVDEVAQILGRTANDTRVLQHRATAYLRKRLVAIGRGPRRAEKSSRMRTATVQAPVLRSRRFALHD